MKKLLHPTVSVIFLFTSLPLNVINYSNKRCVYADQSKLVFAHKMYGFPYYDASGTYGISNRDNYVIINKTAVEMLQLRAFFSTKLALYIFEATRYRMKYLEKYIFEMIPDITVVQDFPQIINDDTLAKYFSLDELEFEAIKGHTTKDYTQIM